MTKADAPYRSLLNRRPLSTGRVGFGAYGLVLGSRLRRGAGPAGALVIFAAMIQTGLSGDRGPGGVEPSYSNLLSFSTFTVGCPVAAGFACWMGGSDARAGALWLDDIAARRRLPRIVEALSPAVLWPLFAYFVAAVVIAMREWPDITLAVDALVSNAASLVAAACVGWAVGRAAPQRVVAPLTGFAVWLLCREEGEGLQERLGLGSGTVPTSYTSDVPGLTELYASPIPAWLPWTVTGSFLGVAAAAVLMSTRRWISACLVLSLVVTGKIWVASVPGPDGDERTAPAPVALDCAGDEPEICASEDLLAPPLIRDQAEWVVRRLDGVRGAPAHYVLTRAPIRAAGGDVTYEGSESYRRPGSWTLTANTLSRDLISARLPLISALGEELASSPASGRCGARHATEVYNWLVPPGLRVVMTDMRALPSRIRGASATSRLDDLPHRQRTEWLSRYFSGPGCPELPAPSDRPEAAQ